MWGRHMSRWIGDPAGAMHIVQHSVALVIITPQVFMNDCMCSLLGDPERRNLVKLEGSLGRGVLENLSPERFIPTNQEFVLKTASEEVQIFIGI